MRNTAGLLLASLLCAGCATGYHSAKNPILGLTGGYFDLPGPGNLHIVGFAGNSFIAREQAYAFMMYRTAEVAQARGHEYFSVYRRVFQAVIDQPAGEFEMDDIGGKPSDHLYVMFHETEVPGSLRAADVLARYESAVRPQGGAQ